MWEIKKLAERREQMAIRAYEEDKRREECIQKIEEDKRREECIQKIKEDKRHEEWNQKIKEVINLIQYFIRNSISPIKMPQLVTTMVPAVTTTVLAKPIQNYPCYDDLTSDQNKKTTVKGVGKEGFSYALNKIKGSYLGLRHCATNRKRKKRKGPYVWTKSKSRVVIEAFANLESRMMVSLLAKRVASNLLRVRTIASYSRFFSCQDYQYLQHDSKGECILKDANERIGEAMDTVNCIIPGKLKLYGVPDDPQAFYIIVVFGDLETRDPYGGYAVELFLEDSFYDIYGIQMDFTGDNRKIIIPKKKSAGIETIVGNALNLESFEIQGFSNRKLVFMGLENAKVKTEGYVVSPFCFFGIESRIVRDSGVSNWKLVFMGLENTKFEYDSQDECILKSDDRYGSVVHDIVKDVFSPRRSPIGNLACLLNVADDRIGFTYEPRMLPRWRAVEDDKALYLQRIMTSSSRLLNTNCFQYDKCDNGCILKCDDRALYLLRGMPAMHKEFMDELSKLELKEYVPRYEFMFAIHPDDVKDSVRDMNLSFHLHVLRGVDSEPSGYYYHVLHDKKERMRLVEPPSEVEAEYESSHDCDGIKAEHVSCIIDLD
nr:hypothetical protein [Tanacetum cinerariifolium]